MNKTEIAELLEQKFSSIHKWLLEDDDQKFNYSSRLGKWTTGEHIDHLIRSTNAVNKGMRVPKFILKWKMGICNRAERSYAETVDRYQEALDDGRAVAMGRFIPDVVLNEDKARKVDELNKAGKTLIKNINNSSEEQLSKYILPHPVIGYLTFREMGYFTAYHTEHHHKILQEFH